MKKAVLAALAIPVIVAMTLGAMFILVRATLIVSSLPSPVMRGVAFGAELLLGVVLLLGTVWLATHFAVRIFADDDRISGGEPHLPSK
jgi:hypothetical protein